MVRTSRRSTSGNFATSNSSRARSLRMYSRSLFAARKAPRPIATVPPSNSARPASRTMPVEAAAPCTPETTAKAATSPSLAPNTRSRTFLPPGMCPASEWVAPSSRVLRKKPGRRSGSSHLLPPLCNEADVALFGGTNCHGGREVTTARPASILGTVLKTILTLSIIWLATSAAAAEELRAGGDAQQAQSLRRAVALLDYVAGDYGRSIGPGGEILSPVEFAEQQQFVLEAVREVRADAGADGEDLAKRLETLLSRVKDRAPPA